MRGHRSRRIAIAVVLAATAAFFAAAVAASAHDGKGDGKSDGHESQSARLLLSSSLAPSIPSDPAIHGVTAGGLPWVLQHGKVRLNADGHLRLKLEGLVIPVAHGSLPAGTALPVISVSASLYCAPDASAAAVTSKTVPLSPDGDAELEDTVALPATCLAPIVLVHPNGLAGAYIAVTGARSQ